MWALRRATPPRVAPKVLTLLEPQVEWVTWQRVVEGTEETRDARPVSSGLSPHQSQKQASRPLWKAADLPLELPSGPPDRAHGVSRFFPSTCV